MLLLSDNKGFLASKKKNLYKNVPINQSVIFADAAVSVGYCLVSMVMECVLLNSLQTPEWLVLDTRMGWDSLKAGS